MPWATQLAVDKSKRTAQELSTYVAEACDLYMLRAAGGDHVRSFKMDPQVFAGSKPEQRAMDARDGSLAHFVYTRDGDNGGLIYWLGTRR